jgi:hypothetical protein
VKINLQKFPTPCKRRETNYRCDYTPYERSVVATNQKKLAKFYGGWGFEGCDEYGPMWGFVMMW